MKKIVGGEYSSERVMFKSEDIYVSSARFIDGDGESPLKESRGVHLTDCELMSRYPLWYCSDVSVRSCVIRESARSGIWYTDGIRIEDSLIESTKTLRRASDVSLKDVRMPNATECLWCCQGVSIENVTAEGEYFGMNSSDIQIDGFNFTGKYLFDGAKNVVVRNSRLVSKDAFWNCENVTVYDSYIKGEYLAWNSKNVTFVNCDIESNQGLCYMENVTLRDCRLTKTDLCFEYCTVDAEIDSHVDSVKNPIAGRIVARSIGEIILDDADIDAGATEITELDG